MSNLRPHKVLQTRGEFNDTHALSLKTGDFAGIIFSYNSVAFNEDPGSDHLSIAFDYEVHDVPEHLENYDKSSFEKELGDFLLELVEYGLEKDNLGYITDEQNREDDTIELDPQRDVLPEGGTVSKD